MKRLAFMFALLVSVTALAQATPALRVNGLDMPDGTSLSTSAAGHATIRYNNTSHTLEQSVNGTTWVPTGTVTLTADAAIAQYALVKVATTAERVTTLLHTDSAVLAVSMALTSAAGPGSSLLVQLVRGVEVTMISDGALSIASGDLVQLSATADGEITKGNTTPIGVAMSACTATPGCTLHVLGNWAGGGSSTPAGPTITSLSETSGNLGDTVILTGTNLTGASAVDFNGTAATSFTVNSSTQITAVVANGTTTGVVHATTASGTANGPTWTLSTATLNKAIVLAYSSAGPVGSAITMALPIWLPQDVTQIRIHIANLDVSHATTTVGACSGVDVGLGTSGNTAAPGVSYSGSPTKWLSQTIPANGADLALPSSSTWQAVTRGADGKVILAYTIPGACTFYQTGTGVTLGGRNVGTASVDPLPSLSANNSVAYTVHIEYVTGHKRVVVLGDSIAAGFAPSPYNSDLANTAWNKLGPDYGYAVDGNGFPGSTLEQWSDATNYPHLTDQQTYSGSYCVIEVGINSLVVDTLAQYQTNITNKVSALHSAGCKKVYVMTPTPSTTYSAQDSLRQTWLTWLRGTPTPASIDGIIDADSVIASSPGASTMNASYNDGDGTHWNNAGHAVVEPLNHALIN